MPNIAHFEDQDIFASEVLRAKRSIYFYGGSIRSGKTIVELNIFNLLCQIYPGSRWFVVRKDSEVIKRTTINSYKKYCFPNRWIDRFSDSKLISYFKNGSQIEFMGENIDRDPDLNRFKGLEGNGFQLEQAEELDKRTYEIAASRMGQWRLNPMPPMIMMLNSNPAQNWVKTTFYDPYKAGTLPSSIYFQLADIFKNPYITPEYLALQKQILPPEVYDRYIIGNWDAVDEAYQLMPWELIHKAR
jgi:hypothetical protein